jgi:osmotically-inducible protein OsmY
VVTERANVYLMGLVTPEESDIAVEATRSVTGVVRVIKVFEYI